MWKTILFRYFPVLRWFNTGYGVQQGLSRLDKLLLERDRRERENSKNRFSKLKVEDGIKRYEKRQLENKGEKVKSFFSLRNIIILLILFFTFLYIYYEKYSTQSIYIAIFIFVAITLYLLIVERYKEKLLIEEQLKELKRAREREHKEFLQRVKEIEKSEKNIITTITLKNEEGYDVKTWKVGRETSLILGKSTLKFKVDIDVTDALYSGLVSRAHGMLNKVNGIWYYEDLSSRNGSGLERISEGKKVKLKSNTPVKVESGDIIYLATTKILLN